MRKICVGLACLVLVAASASTACAQRPEGGMVEISVLGGYTNVAPDRGDNATVFGVPSGAGAYPVSPILRLTGWTRSQLIYEFGFSFMAVSEDDENFSILNAEGGLGTTFGVPEGKSIPFITGVVGILTFSNGASETGSYIGGIAGFRFFFRERAVSRIQFGYRQFLSDNLNIDHTIEIAAGIGVVI